MADGTVMHQGDQPYLLQCRSTDGSNVTLEYSPHTSELRMPGGESLIEDVEAARFDDCERVSPETPGWKASDPDTLKIQLGMRCNYTCSYCNQSSAMEDATVTRTADSDDFIAGLDQWLTGAPQRIEFWGGEPLLYFAKLKRLVPELKRKFPDVQFSMVTNGSLLDTRKIDFIERWDIFISLSHDGPGQHLRGPDPFDEPAQAEAIRELCRRRGGERRRMNFHVVLTTENADIAKTRAWFAERVGDDDVLLDTEGVVSVYDERTLNGSGRWTEKDYGVLHESIVAGFVSGDSLRFRDMQNKARDFILSLKRRRPSSALGQKCGMDQPDQLAVDLKGNVMTCQNTGAQGAHHLGNVDNLEAVQLDTATHWSFRESCRHCPVLQLCKGSCMYLADDLFAQSCENEYHYNMAILAGTLKSVTGLELLRIDGDIRRPAPRRRTIPIAAVH